MGGKSGGRFGHEAQQILMVARLAKLAGWHGGCAVRWARLEGGKVGGRERGDQRWEGWKVGPGKEKNGS